MKTRKQKFAIVLTAVMMFMLTAITTQSQIRFQGLVSQGEGSAIWNADGSGPELAATGHPIPFSGFENQGYYYATRDYIKPQTASAELPLPTPYTGFHLQGPVSGFPLFTQSLLDNGISLKQIKVKFRISTLGKDLKGEDWLILNDKHYANYYDLRFVFEIKGEPMIKGVISYANISESSNEKSLFAEYSFTEPVDASSSSSNKVQEVANAFLQDLAGEEMHITHYMTYAKYLTGNGRMGTYYNIIQGAINKGTPGISIQGLAKDHLGYAVWNADGTGLEPCKTGHNNTPYYKASRDYDNLDSDPNAALCSFLSNSNGFTNFYLQLAYQGYKPEQVKIKTNAQNMDEDIMGEDWIIINGVHRFNYYNSSAIVEIDGNPLLGFIEDTTKFLCKSGALDATSSACIVYDAREDDSYKMRILAEKFLKDLGQRQLQVEMVGKKAPGTFIGNGRIGSFCEITSGKISATKPNCTKVSQGKISGTWSASEGPYIITGDVTIPNGKTLQIEPGTWLKIMDGHTINIKGTIEAVGDDSNTGGIVFTSVNPKNGWGGIRFVNTSETPAPSKLINCIFANGSAAGKEPYNSGGAIAVKDYDDLVIDNCLFIDNSAVKSGSTYPPSGGAIALWGSSPKITNSTFINNKAEYGGAIILYNESNARIEHNLFFDNESNTSGGAIEIMTNSNPILLNNTITRNKSKYGGGIDISDNSKPIIINTILIGNIAKQWRQISITTSDCKISTTYSDIEKGLSDIGPYPYQGLYIHNISTNPLFLNKLANDFHLTQNSPCVNTGTPVVLDPNNTRSDMGAFYFASPASPVARIATDITYYSFQANWMSAFDAEYYKLYVAYDEEFKDYVKGYNGLIVSENTSCLVGDLKDNTMYYYRLTALNDVGYSAFSNIISLKTPLPSVEKFAVNEVVLRQVNSGLVVTIPGEVQANSDIYIYNIMGQLLQHQSLNSGANNISLKQDHRILIVKVICDNKCDTRKIFQW